MTSRIVIPAAALVAAALAVETRTWRHATQAEFEKGSFKRLALRSDGRMFLSPVFVEVFDAATPYLWAFAEDSAGNLYAGGGGPGAATAKLFRIDAAGKGAVLAELPGLEIHAVAVDSRGQVFAATSPDGKIYRVSRDGKHEVFYDPKAKYIWAMAFHRSGDLFVATGDRGEVHRVTPAGQGSVFFPTEEAHARSLAIDGAGNVIVGTEPGGLILRVSPAGEGFVLYQAPKREVTAVAIARDGSIYAAAVVNKVPAAPLPEVTAPPPAVPPPATPPAAPGATLTVAQRPPVTLPPTLGGPAASVAGGSEVYRIDPDGYPRRVWNHPTEIVYAIAFDAAGRAIIGTGNRGNIYRLDSDVLYSLLASASPTQVTGLFPGAGGRLWVVTGNIGKVFRLGPETERTGTFESEALDAGFFTYWGRLEYRAVGGAGVVAVETRSGNLDRPQRNWSPWAAAPLNSSGGRIVSPPARFLQYRLTLTAAPDGSSPEVTSVEVAHLAKNVAPVVEEIQATPANYRFPPQSLTLTPSTSLTLPALGRARRPAAPALPSPDSAAVTMQYAKGYVGARWLARDDNADVLQYTVEIRGPRESEWRLLKDNVRERHLSWDSTAFPDGEYRLRVTASDAPDNPPHQALSASAESEPFLIDNTPPRISGLAAVRAGVRIEARWRAEDSLSVLKKAEYSINGGEWLIAQPTTRLTDSRAHDYLISADAPAGEATVAVRVSDANDNQAVEKTVVK
jgi:hypothetical protein